MKYRYLGKSGLVVSELALGTMTFGASGWGCDAKEAHRMIAAYLEAGGTMIDTADVYAKGQAESIIGDYMANMKRDEIILATKCNFPMGTTPNKVGSNRKYLVGSVEASLKRLKTDYIDIYYLHRSDPSAPPEEVMETLDILVRQGKILYIACSNLPAWRIMLDNSAAKARQMSGFICGQYMYNLVDRHCEQEIIPAMVHEGIGFLCWSPLAGGMLTGKYDTSATVPQGSRFDLRKSLDIPRFWTEQGRQVTGEFLKIAKELDVAPAKLAVAWLLSRDFVSSVLLGARTAEQLSVSLEATDYELSAEVKARLDAVSEPAKNYLWSFNDETNGQFRARGKAFPGTIIC
ncbi:MAG: aldo/keto reductase [Spirochaetae bacterium HGW-Spirochaetae-9]|nr:MAG: aldo/keto reductase [Spirochaetae bacterium HGW-Spirochaetae-9]